MPDSFEFNKSAAGRSTKNRTGDGAGDKIPIGALMNKGLTIKTGQTHMRRDRRPLLEKIENGEIAPSFIITHRLSLDDAPKGGEMFKHKRDNCIRVVLKPGLTGDNGEVH